MKHFYILKAELLVMKNSTYGYISGKFYLFFIYIYSFIDQ